MDMAVCLKCNALWVNSTTRQKLIGKCFGNLTSLCKEGYLDMNQIRWMPNNVGCSRKKIFFKTYILGSNP